MSILDKLGREYAYVTGVAKLLKSLGKTDPGTRRTIVDGFEASVDAHKHNVAIRFEGKLFTYEELDQRANQYANWALAQGFKRGDAVALFMDNKPDYIAFWMGLAKVGVVSALINNNLQGSGLAHCINISNAKALVFGPEQEENLNTAKDEMTEGLALWSLGGEIDGAESLDTALQSLPAERPAASVRDGMTVDDLCLYLYTSGTTGLPKAAKLPHSRVIIMMNTFTTPCKITARDRIYVTLPLYHATGGLCAVGQALMTGGSIILRRKFSATHFWEDAVKEGATSFVYIGELCRYLLNSPEHPLEKTHTIRKGFGNGLRPEVWQPFVDRFNIPHLVEFYGATEGNISFLNFDGKVGTVGRLPKYIEKRVQAKIVKFDIASEQPVRDEKGFCIEADHDEVGELIGLIGDKQRFDGYNDPEQTKKKILEDVFETGDKWFRTGDLMKKDENAYIYFVDRIGDTFRWKGENVSTNEVAEALAAFEGVKLPNVYGVQMPESDGRAGMASVALNGAELDGKALANHVDMALPVYARPVFIRIQDDADTTGTLKYKKVDLVEAGYDLSKITDSIFVRTPDSDTYEPLTEALLEKINQGEIKF